MSLLQTKWISDDAVNESKFKATNNAFIRARNAADNADVNIIKVNASDLIELASDAYVGANKVQTAADKGVANGIVPLNGSSLIDASFLPSYVDDVLEFANLAAFPGTGATGLIYVALDTNLIYRWTGSVYVEISPSAIVTAADVNYTQANPANWTIADGSPVSGTLDEVGSRLVALEGAPAGYTPAYQTFTLAAGDITNQFVTLSQTPIGGSVTAFPKGGLEQEFGVDFSLTGAQFNFLGDLATLLAVGDKLIIKYVY